jgi:hypothetical protein
MSALLYRVIGCSLILPVKVGVEESIVNAPRIKNHGSAALETDKWDVHNRFFNASFDRKFQWTPDIFFQQFYKALYFILLKLNYGLTFIYNIF